MSSAEKGAEESSKECTTEAVEAPKTNTVESTDKTSGNETKTEDKPASEEPKLSKKQLKKKRRWERAMEVKKRRKLQDKEIKHAKAKAAGRDLEQERKEELKRREDGAGRRRRQARWEEEKLPLIKSSFQVVIDCAFESEMTKKEIGSLSSQIRYCYAVNKNNPHPCLFTATGLTGPTLDNLQNVSGFEGWSSKGFANSEKPLEEVFKDRLKDVIYLTSDSKIVVEHLDDSKIYVIGGIVDRNRLSRAAINRAGKIGVATGKLPLEDHLKIAATKVLTCNHVFQILLKYRQYGKNWEKALLEVLPARKDVVAKNQRSSETENKPKEATEDNKLEVGKADSKSEDNAASTQENEAEEATKDK